MVFFNKGQPAIELAIGLVLQTYYGTRRQVGLITDEFVLSVVIIVFVEPESMVIAFQYPVPALPIVSQKYLES